MVALATNQSPLFPKVVWKSGVRGSFGWLMCPKSMLRPLPSVPGCDFARGAKKNFPVGFDASRSPRVDFLTGGVPPVKAGGVSARPEWLKLGEIPTNGPNPSNVEGLTDDS